MFQILNEAIRLTRQDPGALSIPDAFMKTMEELGEFSKSVLALEGKVKIKPGMEEPIYEAADMILMIIDILAKAHPELTAEQITTMLDYAITKKFMVWNKYMEENKQYAEQN